MLCIIKKPVFHKYVMSLIKYLYCCLSGHHVYKVISFTQDKYSNATDTNLILKCQYCGVYDRVRELVMKR